MTISPSDVRVAKGYRPGDRHFHLEAQIEGLLYPPTVWCTLEAAPNSGPRGAPICLHLTDAEKVVVFSLDAAKIVAARHFNRAQRKLEHKTKK